MGDFFRLAILIEQVHAAQYIKPFDPTLHEDEAEQLREDEREDRANYLEEGSEP